MSGNELRDAIRALLNSHPGISPSPVGHAAHAERYLTRKGMPIGFEPDRIEHQNIWVRADAVRLHMISGIDHVTYQHTDFATSKPNHNLFGEPAFKDNDLIRFKIVDIWQAVRVILEVAGDSSK